MRPFFTQLALSQEHEPRPKKRAEATHLFNYRNKSPNLPFELVHRLEWQQIIWPGFRRQKKK